MSSTNDRSQSPLSRPLADIIAAPAFSFQPSASLPKQVNSTPRARQQLLDGISLAQQRLKAAINAQKAALHAETAKLNRLLLDMPRSLERMLSASREDWELTGDIVTMVMQSWTYEHATEEMTGETAEARAERERLELGQRRPRPGWGFL